VARAVPPGIRSYRPKPTSAGSGVSCAAALRELRRALRDARPANATLEVTSDYLQSFKFRESMTALPESSPSESSGSVDHAGLELSIDRAELGDSGRGKPVRQRRTHKWDEPDK
jgi:hypothetical protein